MGHYATPEDLRRRIGVYIPQLDSKTIPRWDTLPSDVQALIGKIIEVAAEVPHLIRYWSDAGDEQRHWRAFLNVHLRDLHGWDAERANAALGRAVELGLAVRPNPTGRLQFIGASASDPACKGITGDYVLLTEAAHESHKNREKAAPIDRPAGNGRLQPAMPDHLDVDDRRLPDGFDWERELSPDHVHDETCYRQVLDCFKVNGTPMADGNYRVFVKQSTWSRIHHIILTPKSLQDAALLSPETPRVVSESMLDDIRAAQTKPPLPGSGTPAWHAWVCMRLIEDAQPEVEELSAPSPRGKIAVRCLIERFRLSDPDPTVVYVPREAMEHLRLAAGQPTATQTKKRKTRTSKTKSLPNLGDWNTLTDRQRNCMRALHESGAFNADSRLRAQDVAVKAEGRDASVESFKEPLSDLVLRGLLESKTGRDGGYWLTDRGRRLIAAADADSATGLPA